jgi:hypothetical protein
MALVHAGLTPWTYEDKMGQQLPFLSSDEESIFGFAHENSSHTIA